MNAPLSLAAGGTDRVFWFWVAVSLLFYAGLTATMVAFVVRYRRGRPHRLPPSEGSLLLEVTWTLVPTGLFLAIFAFGWTDYRRMRTVPREALGVTVTGRQWSWSFRYPNGKETARLYAPVDRPIGLDVLTADVIHGFYIPDFRLKADAVPGHVNRTWFQATREGIYDIQCTVICGVDHSRMVAEAVIVPEADFRAWYFGGEEAPEPQAPQPRGLALLRDHGCLACHTLDGRPAVGPTFKGLLGRTEQVDTPRGLETIRVDERRIRTAIVDADHAPVRGYPRVMPAAALGPDDLDRAVGFLKGCR